MQIVEVRVGGPIEPWQAVGAVGDEPRLEVEGCRLVVDSSLPPGVAGLGLWAPDGGAVPAELDGVPVSPATPPTRADTTDLGIVGWDHLVLMTPALERTCGAVEAATGAPLKRIREAGNGVRQGFHRLGSLVVEVVESPQIPSGPARAWGFVWNVGDLDEQARRLGADVLSAPRDAVQPGRRIASFRAGVGLGAAVALMSPAPTRRS